ncbi:MAG: lysylphosphatidylglycerol synthase transmembrane domain-containing protein [Candidatus Hydrothermarchaeaceae archaeon]
MKIRKIQLLIGILILMLYIWKLDVVGSLGNLKEKINYPYLVIAFLMSSSILAVRAVRWAYVARKMDIALLSLTDSLKYTGASFFVSLLTPGKVGDASRMLFMKDSDKTRVLAGVSTEYLIDVFITILLPLALSLLFIYEVELFAGILILFSLLGALIALSLSKISTERIARIVTGKNADMVAKNRDNYIETLKHGLKFEIVIVCFALSLVMRLLTYSAIYIAFMSIYIEIDVLTLFAGLAMGQLVGVISFIPMGLGSREVGSLGFFVFMGYDPVVMGGALIVARLLTLSPLIASYAFYLMLTLGNRP